MKHNTEHVVSGERLTLGSSSERNQLDHTARYEFACQYAAEKRALDIACGTGYGAVLLSDAGAVDVTGVDIDEASIAYAKEHAMKPNIQYICAAAEDTVFADETFGLIASFETIEHLEAEPRRKYLENLQKSLKKDGVLILSTPNKLITSPWSKKPLNPYHVLEYYTDTLAAELTTAGFIIEGWYGQRFVRNIFTKRPMYLGIRVIEKALRRSFGIYDVADSPKVQVIKKGFHPRYFVVILKKK